MRSVLPVFLLATILVSLLGSVAGAKDPGPTPPAADEEFAVGDAVSEQELGGSRGGQGTSTVVLSESALGATLGNNTVVSSTNGGNVISDHAFGNATGFPTVIQNSGNNVLIQSSTIVNLSVQQ